MAFQMSWNGRRHCESRCGGDEGTGRKRWHPYMKQEGKRGGCGGRSVYSKYQWIDYLLRWRKINLEETTDRGGTSEVVSVADVGGETAEFHMSAPMQPSMLQRKSWGVVPGAWEQGLLFITSKQKTCIALAYGYTFNLWEVRAVKS